MDSTVDSPADSPVENATALLTVAEMARADADTIASGVSGAALMVSAISPPVVAIASCG